MLMSVLMYTLLFPHMEYYPLVHLVAVEAGFVFVMTS